MAIGLGLVWKQVLGTKAQDRGRQVGRGKMQLTFRRIESETNEMITISKE
jgi:hypothetical protein